MRCLIDNCDALLRHKWETGISSHRFPKNAGKRAAWLKILDPTGTQYKVTDNSRICSLHFVKSDFHEGYQGKRQLNPNALPSMNLGQASQLEGPQPPVEREPWDIPRKVPVRLKKSETIWVQPIKYAGDLKTAHMDQMSPRLAKHVLPKVYKQLQNTTIRLNRYKQRCRYYQRQTLQLKSLLIEMSAQHGISIPSGIRMREQIESLTGDIQMPIESDVEDADPDPLSGDNGEMKIEPPEETQDDPDDEEPNEDGNNDEEDDDDEDYLGVRLEDEAVQELMAVL